MELQISVDNCYTKLKFIAKASSIESAFKTMCTVPNTTTHFVSSPDTRKTLDILWSCLFTIIACTLTIQHLNWSLKDTWRSVKWMFITILAPELLLAKGASDLQHARLSQVELKRLAQEDGVPWTLTHTLFENMGGFVIRRVQENGSRLRIVSFQSETIQDLPPNPCHVMAADIITLRKSGSLSKLPCITSEEINDKIKANLFIKSIAVTQILWMVVQILVCAGRKLAISQLEVSILAFSAYAVIIYFLHWQKPKDIKTPYTLVVLPGETLGSTLDSLRNNHTNEWGNGFFYKENSFACPSNCLEAVLLAGIFIGCFVFGGIHMAAWNFHFHTRTDLIIWRVASTFCTTFALIYLLVVSVQLIIFAICFELELETQEILLSIIGLALALLYLVGRLILLVEIFRTLLFLPPHAFVATSASNIPHVA
ncbi:hypothetical protein N431DRAFT_516178 [Stipitochalara longipes BDJ]|nr:hypothetical protein N431DRAFT_516178 [Stipitochalara longipes BDJ]